MEKNTLRKRRFLCFDLTPRWKMWKRIEDLEVRLATRLIEREHEVLALTQARDTLYKRIDELEGRLRKFDRTRGKSGKYIKGYDVRTAK